MGDIVASGAPAVASDAAQARIFPMPQIPNGQAANAKENPKKMKNGHPDFSGMWICKDVNGDVDTFLTDMGMGYVKRNAAKAYGYGVGKSTQNIIQNGSHFRVQAKDFSSQTSQYEADGKDYLVGRDGESRILTA